jgi:uncharacterized membrane protein YjjB (DUF3815 family)
MNAQCGQAIEARTGTIFHTFLSAAISALCFTVVVHSETRNSVWLLPVGTITTVVELIVEQYAICITIAERVAGWGFPILD